MGQKSQRRDGGCGGCLGTTVGFLFDAKWKFSFETSWIAVAGVSGRRRCAY